MIVNLLVFYFCLFLLFHGLIKLTGLLIPRLDMKCKVKWVLYFLSLMIIIFDFIGEFGSISSFDGKIGAEQTARAILACFAVITMYWLIMKLYRFLVFSTQDVVSSKIHEIKGLIADSVKVDFVEKVTEAVIEELCKNSRYEILKRCVEIVGRKDREYLVLKDQGSFFFLNKVSDKPFIIITIGKLFDQKFAVSYETVLKNRKRSQRNRKENTEGVFISYEEDKRAVSYLEQVLKVYINEVQKYLLTNYGDIDSEVV